MKEQGFPQSVSEQLGYYVYTLADPTTGKVFYVGKGTGNRVFTHARAAMKRGRKDEKLATIRRILGQGKTVKHEIIRHGMTEKEAFEVESALIDIYKLEGLLNKVGGHDMEQRGRMTDREIRARYCAAPIRIREPALLIIVNRLWERNISPERLYEITRGNWVVGPRREKARYAFSVYKGVVREVYRIDGWRQAKVRRKDQAQQNRWRFRGGVATELQRYVGRSVASYLKPGAQSPVRYLNC